MVIPPALPAEPFTTAQARGWGITDHRLQTLVDTGRIRRVLRGVYVRSDVPDTIQTRALAARLVLKPFTVLCDRTAAWLHGVDTFTVAELEILPPLEAWSLRNNTRVRRDGCAGGRRDLAPQDVVRIQGVPVTTPIRTAMDLACRLKRRDALAALDAFMLAFGLTREDFERELPRYRRRRGVIQLRQLIALADPRSESPGESWTRLCIIDDGLPAPDLQVWVTDQGRPRYRLDLAYRLHKVAIEYDGRDFHDDPRRRAADEQRRAWLREQGWTVIVVNRDSFSDDALASWLRELRAALAARRPR